MTITCAPKSHNIAQAFFNYGKDNLNGSDSANWQPANWAVGELTSGPTVKSGSFAAYFIDATYDTGELMLLTECLPLFLVLDGAKQCIGSWLQYGKNELLAHDGQLTKIEAQEYCQARDASLPGSMFDNGKQAIKVLLSVAQIDKAWISTKAVNQNYEGIIESPSNKHGVICVRSSTFFTTSQAFSP